MTGDGPMDKNRLRELLADLHRELTGAGPVDAETRLLLDQVLEDLRRLTGEQPAGTLADGTTSQLREAALRLESAHPQLANVIGQLTDTLSKLGI